MPDVWVEKPRTYPYRCAISGRSSTEEGPYYEYDMEFRRSDDGPLERLYISQKYLLVPFSREGSPIRVLSGEAAEQIILENEMLRDRTRELDLEVEALNLAMDRQTDVFARARTRKTPAKRKPREKAPEE